MEYEVLEEHPAVVEAHHGVIEEHPAVKRLTMVS
jgi:hypothetical protein